MYSSMDCNSCICFCSIKSLLLLCLVEGEVLLMLLLLTGGDDDAFSLPQLEDEDGDVMASPLRGVAACCCCCCCPNMNDDRMLLPSCRIRFSSLLLLIILRWCSYFDD